MPELRSCSRYSGLFSAGNSLVTSSASRIDSCTGRRGTCGCVGGVAAPAPAPCGGRPPAPAPTSACGGAARRRPTHRHQLVCAVRLLCRLRLGVVRRDVAVRQSGLDHLLLCSGGAACHGGGCEARMGWQSSERVMQRLRTAAPPSLPAPSPPAQPPSPPSSLTLVWAAVAPASAIIPSTAPAALTCPASTLPASLALSWRFRRCTQAGGSRGGSVLQPEQRPAETGGSPHPRQTRRSTANRTAQRSAPAAPATQTPPPAACWPPAACPAQSRSRCRAACSCAPAPAPPSA